VSLANVQNDSTYGPAIDLLSLVSDNSATTTTTATHTAAFPSWLGTNEQSVGLHMKLSK
jgi:hypothetical protein